MIASPNSSRSTVSLRTKLILAVAVPAFALVVAAGAQAWVTAYVKDQVHLARTESVIFAGLAHDLKVNVLQVQQFLSDVSATRAQDGLDSGFAEADRAATEFRSGLARFEVMFKNENDTRQLAAIASLRAAFDTYQTAGVAMARAYVEKGPAGGNALMPAFDQAAARLVEPLENFRRGQTDELERVMLGIESSTSLLRTISAVAAAVVLLGSVVALIAMLRSIVRPVRAVTEQLAAGATQTAEVAAQVSSSSQSLAHGATRQAASLQETSASLEEISSMTQRNAEHAREAKELSGLTCAAAQAGANDMAEMRQAMAAIRASGDEISKIVKTIDEVAFQTNILAINAAVEAARAGEAGGRVCRRRRRSAQSRPALRRKRPPNLAAHRGLRAEEHSWGRCCGSGRCLSWGHGGKGPQGRQSGSRDRPRVPRTDAGHPTAEPRSVRNGCRNPVQCGQCGGDGGGGGRAQRPGRVHATGGG
jgi:hypothetical protein